MNTYETTNWICSQCANMATDAENSEPCSSCGCTHWAPLNSSASYSRCQLFWPLIRIQLLLSGLVLSLSWISLFHNCDRDWGQDIARSGITNALGLLTLGVGTLCLIDSLRSKFSLPERCILRPVSLFVILFGLFAIVIPPMGC